MFQVLINNYSVKIYKAQFIRTEELFADHQRVEMAVFWHVAPCSLQIMTNVSEESTASIIWVI
jgi:hypothetical protein